MLSNRFDILSICLLTSLLAISLSAVIIENRPNRELNDGNSEIVFLLRLQWPPGKCISMGSGCEEDLIQDSYWTIHGLWAQIDCESRYEFNYNLLTDSLTDKLNKYWLNIKSGETNKDFWGDEYEKHGCATEWREVAYFRKALELYQEYTPGPQLSQAGITPGGRYSIDKFESAFNTFVKVKCNDDNSISELEFCFDGAYNIIDCIKDQYSCSGDTIYFPKLQEEEPYRNLIISRRVSW